MSDTFEGDVGVVACNGKIYCYGNKPAFHETMGAGGVRVRKGSRLACVELGSKEEVPIEGALKDAIDRDIEMQRRKG